MKRRAPTIISEQDAALFREAIGAVRTLAVDAEVPERPKPEPAARMRLQDEAEALLASRSADAIEAQFNADEPLAFRSPQISERTFRQLRRGQYSVQDEIDLHQLRAAQAQAVLKQFLAEACRKGRQCVRIIHGKGLRSEQGPVLKAMVDSALRHHGDVLAFSSAPASQGGTGAALVLLKPSS